MNVVEVEPELFTIPPDHIFKHHPVVKPSLVVEGCSPAYSGPQGLAGIGSLGLDEAVLVCIMMRQE